MRFCRLCGRAAKKVKLLEGVLHAHSGITKDRNRETKAELGPEALPPAGKDNDGPGHRGIVPVGVVI